MVIRYWFMPVVLLFSSCGSVASRHHEFALIGDNPYSAAMIPAYVRMIEDINSYDALRWVIHLGDVKSSVDSCADEALQGYFQLNQRFDPAFVVTPGDNDWLDCSAPQAGGFNEYERLAAFRRQFFPLPGQTTGGRPMAVNQQSAQGEFAEFVENLRWRHQDVVYATVHTVALMAPPSDPVLDQRRIDAAVAWIRGTFAEAAATGARAVFLAMQADPWPLSGSGAVARQPRATLEWLYPVLAEESVAFGRPVALAVGDTHQFRVDKPLFAEGVGNVRNFTRVESFGNPQVNWVHVKVEPDSPWVFTFREQPVE